MNEEQKKVFSKLGIINNNLQQIYLSLENLATLHINTNTIEFYQKMSLICSTILSILQIEKVTTVKEYLVKAQKKIKEYFKKYGNGTTIEIDENDFENDNIRAIQAYKLLENLKILPQMIEVRLEDDGE